MKSKSILSYWSRSKYIIVVTLLCICAMILFVYRMKTNQDIQVYDLTWPDKTDVNRPLFRRWRYFIESKTSLPRKVEKYYKLAPEDDYTLEETLVVSYPTTEEIKSVIKDAGF